MAAHMLMRDVSEARLDSPFGSPSHGRRPLDPLAPLGPPGPPGPAAAPPEDEEEVGEARLEPRGGGARGGGTGAVPQVPRLHCDAVQAAATFQQEDGLSAEFLRHYCETLDLDAVAHLEIQVDSAAQNIESLGEHLQNLRQLKLRDSSVLSFRDFGTELRHLEVLWMSRCGLQDLGGATSAFPQLREFYLPFNDITDLSPLSGHECLEVLDVEGNAVSEVEEVSALRSCPRLRELTLSGNAALRSVSRQAILDMLPQLEILDDVPVGEDPVEHSAALSSRAAAGEPLDDDLFLDDLDALAGAVCAGHGERDAATAGLEAFEAEDSDGSASIESCEGTRANGAAPIRPLRAEHPLLAEGLQKSAAEASRGEVPPSPYAAEPDEDQLITERLKRPRPKPPLPHAFTARPATSGGWFNLQMADRRQVWTAESEPASFRPTSSSGGRPGSSSGGRPPTAGGARPGTSAGSASAPVNFDDMGTAQDAASDLTCGDTSLAGAPLAAVRLRRLQNSGGETSGPTDMDIRELIRRYQTFSQPSCIPTHELINLKREANLRRPGTPDVRIHVAGQDGPRPSTCSSSGLPGVTAAGRPGSSADRPGPGRPGSSGSGSRGPRSPGGSPGGGRSPGGSPHGSPASFASLAGSPDATASEGFSHKLHDVGGKAVLTTLKNGAGEVLALDTETPVDIE